MKKSFTYQNKKIFYHIYGTGKPVILIHGFGETHEVWKNQVEFLQNKLYLIVPDLPGSGESDLTDDMSMEGMAEIIHSIIHEENIEPATVIGHSMGGYVALALAKKYYNHIHALGLFHSTAFADSEEKKTIRGKGIEFINKHGAVEFIKNTTPNLFSQVFKEKNPEFTNEYIRGLNNFLPEALVKYYQAMMQRPDRTDVLINRKVPVLMMMGKYDTAVALNDSLKQCHLAEKMYIHILRLSGHMGMLEEPATTNCILEKFLLEN